MKYLSAFYREKTLSGQATTSLVLQQMYCESIQKTVVFACLCDKDEIAEELLGWFRQKMWTWKKGHTLLEILETAEMYDYMKKIEEGHLLGMLCIGDEFLLFQSGNMSVALINTRWGKNCVREMPLKQRMEVVSGRLESDVGILLMNKEFADATSQKVLQEVLIVQELKVKEQVERRLNALGEKGTAILIVSKEITNG